MASTAQIYGQIGAAKAFASSVSNALDDDSKEKEINELEDELANTQDEEEQKRLKKKIKRKKRINKLQSKTQKAAQKTADFLAKIAAYVDIGIKELINWMANIIVVMLPAIEVSVKMLLLTNIKKMVSCVIDPRIPDYMRNEGILLNESLIDPRRILQTSPFSKWGKYSYFGCFYDKECIYPKSPYSLSRADDMNAFLWFTKNCAHFVTSTIVSDTEANNISTYFDGVDSATTTFFNTHEFKGKPEYPFLEGCTFKHQYSSTIFLLTKKEHRYVNNQNETWYTIVPVSDNWITSGSTTSVWYKDRTSLTGLERKTINYNKSKPLFHLEYIGEQPTSPYNLDGNFSFRILPRPFGVGAGFGVKLASAASRMSDMIDSGQINEYIGSDLINMVDTVNFATNGIQSLNQIYARFNSDGIPDKNGRFSIDCSKFIIEQGYDDGNEINFNIHKIASIGEPCGYLILNKAKKEFRIIPENGYKPQSYITECYFGKTVFEFNYDYVVSMKLFDEKVVASNIVNALMNVNIPIPLRRRNTENGEIIETDTDQIAIDSYVDRMVEKMIDTETGEYTDCFYTFSNEDYDSMEQEVANKIANNSLITKYDDSPINEVYDILDSYDADSTLHEKTEVITNTLMKAASVCGFDDNENSNTPGGRLNGGFDDTSNNNPSSLLEFIKKALKSLLSSVVNSLLTPKVLMLIQVNRLLMGQPAIPNTLKELKDNYTIDVASTLDGLSSVLKDIIRQIIDIILREFLRIILERIKDIFLGYLKKLGIEMAMKWVNILRMLISCFKFNRNKLNANELNSNQSGNIASIINQVDYADIDTLIDEIIPVTNPC